MLKSFSICAALILAAAAFSTSAEAQHRGFGGGARMGGAHFSGARVGSFGGARMGNIAGPGRMGAYGGRVIYSGGRYAGGRAIYSGGRYAYGYGRGYGYRRYGGYWPWLGGAGLAVAAAWPYYGGYGYGYDSCVRLVPDYGWVNVCDNPYYGGYGYY
jgi:hypothetical protein